MSDSPPFNISASYSPSADAKALLTWEDCKAGRQSFGQNLVDLIASSRKHLTIAIDAPWGMGKTHFVNTLRPLLETKSVPHVVLNAWETDYLDDPLSAIVLQLHDHLSGTKKVSQTVKDGIVAAAKKAKDVFANKASDAALRGLSANVVTGQDAKQIATGIKNAIAKRSDPLRGNAAEDMAKTRQAVDAMREFRNRLSSFAAEAGGEGGAPLVIIIDELDRCRPPWSLALLERVKHLFDIEGVVVLISIDAGQLCESIRAVYGAGFDSRRYLRRFIDIHFGLPLGADDALTLTRAIIAKNDSDKFLNTTYIDEIIGALLAGGKIDLRSLHQYCARLNICATLMSPPHDRSWNYDSATRIAIVLLVQYIAPDLYEALIRREVNGDDIYDRFKPPEQMGRIKPMIFREAKGSGVSRLHVFLADIVGEAYVNTLKERLAKLDEDERVEAELELEVNGRWYFCKPEAWAYIVRFADFAMNTRRM